MATSGSVDFTQTRDEIIKDALLLVSGIEDNETPDTYQIDIASRALNRMFKSWTPKGLKLWTTKEGELYLARGQNSYTLGPGGDLNITRPLTCENFRRFLDNTEVPIEKVGRSIFQAQANKSAKGPAVMAYYDPQLDSGVLYVWPTPDNGRTRLLFDYRSYIEDMDTATDNVHFPSEWLDAIVYNLAARLAPMYELVGDDRLYILKLAETLLESATDEDSNDDTVIFSPRLGGVY